MSERRFHLTAAISADSLDDVMFELRDIVRDIERGSYTCTGGLHGGHLFMLKDSAASLGGSPTEDPKR